MSAIMVKYLRRKNVGQIKGIENHKNTGEKKIEMSKKKTGIVIGVGMALCAGVALFVIFGIHRHEWTAATCTKPESCLECGETRGEEALRHTWEEATCILAATCSVCGETEGEALGHTWEEATCTLAATCSVCGEKEGTALGHTWVWANYQDATTCSLCGEIWGDPLTAAFEKSQLTCVSEENRPYDFVTSTRDLPEEKTRATVTMSGYRTFDSDETHPALENYEWVTAQFELIFSDRNNYSYGGSSAWAMSDYFLPELCATSTKNVEEAVSTNEDVDIVTQYTVNYHGVDYEQCIACFMMPRDYDRYTVHSTVFDCYFRIPKGYDGLVVVFYDPQEEAILKSDTSVRIRLKREDSNPEFPGMTVLSGVLPVQPGEILEASTVIRNNENCKSGFYGLQKIAEFENYDKNKMWIREPSYETTTLTTGTELVSQIEMPEEEGIYEVTAAVMSENGNAAISRIIVLVDGTGPEIHVPKEKITIRPGDEFFFLKDVYGVDNSCPDEDCFLEVDMEELQKLAVAMQSAKAGTYNLTYYARDLAGNTGEKTVKLTISRGSGGQSTTSGGQSATSGGQSTTSGGQQTPTVAENQFMEDMAREAFDLVNQYRADANLSALTWNDSIYEGTKIRAQELVLSFSHTRPNGASCFTVLSGFMTYGENIAFGYGSASEVCEGWYNSEGHRNNMLNGDFTQGAIACWYENGTFYWVNLFAG